MSRAASLALFLLAVFALTATAGCTATVRSASRAAVPVVVDQSLTAFEDPHNRERFEQILGSPEMQGAIEETARALVHGAVARGTFDADTEERIQAVASSLTDAVAQVLAKDIRDRILPATVEGMRASLREAISPTDKREVLGAVDALVAEATTTALRSAARELPHSLAPAMRAAIVESLNAPELHSALAGVTADAIRSALISSRDLIIQLHEQSEGTGPVAQLVDRVERMLVRTVVGTFGIGALLGALLMWASRHLPRGGRGSRPSGHGPPSRDPSQGPSQDGGEAERSPARRLDPSPTRAT
jgi:hypothetical protein